MVISTFLMEPVAWPGAWDQPFIASQLVSLGIAIELVQVRSGHNIGRRTARGVLVKGTTEGIREEIEQVFGMLMGAEGKKMRLRAKELQKRVVEDSEVGEARSGMEKLGYIV